MKTFAQVPLLCVVAALLLTPAVHAQAPETAGSQVQITTPAEVPLNISVRHGLAQMKDDLFGDTSQFAKGAKEVTEINMDKGSLNGLGVKGGVPSKMDFMVVHTYSYDKPGMYRIEDIDIYKKRLHEGGWNCFIHTQSKDESTDICSRKAADNETNEMVIMTAEPKELTFIHMRGRMSLDDLEKMNGGGSGGLERRKD